MAFLTMEVSARHARTRAIMRDTVSPANRGERAIKMRRAASRMSFLMCPFCVRAWLLIPTTAVLIPRPEGGEQDPRTSDSSIRSDVDESGTLTRCRCRVDPDRRRW
jgi:hypothetical protein